MRPVLIYFRETHLDGNNKFTLDLSKNKYYITSLNYKLKFKEYIREDKKNKKLSEKSRLLLEKDAAYLCDIDYLMFISEWYK